MCGACAGCWAMEYQSISAGSQEGQLSAEHLANKPCPDLAEKRYIRPRLESEPAGTRKGCLNKTTRPKHAHQARLQGSLPDESPGQNQAYTHDQMFKFSLQSRPSEGFSVQISCELNSFLSSDLESCVARHAPSQTNPDTLRPGDASPPTSPAASTTPWPAQPSHSFRHHPTSLLAPLPP